MEQLKIAPFSIAQQAKLRCTRRNLPFKWYSIPIDLAHLAH